MQRLRHPAVLGAIIGAVFGIWDLIVTWRDPLLDDSPTTLALFYLPMFGLWAVAGFLASRRTGRLADAMKAGGTLALATFIVFTLAVILRINLFLDAITQRADWQNLLVRYRASGFESLRLYANYVYLVGAPFKILVASVIGCCMGLIGGGMGRLNRHRAV